MDGRVADGRYWPPSERRTCTRQAATRSEPIPLARERVELLTVAAERSRPALCPAPSPPRTDGATTQGANALKPASKTRTELWGQIARRLFSENRDAPTSASSQRAASCDPGPALQTETRHRY